MHHTDIQSMVCQCVQLCTALVGIICTWLILPLTVLKACIGRQFPELAPIPPPPLTTLTTLLSPQSKQRTSVQHAMGNTADPGGRCYAEAHPQCQHSFAILHTGSCSRAYCQTHYYCNAGASPLRRQTGSQPSNTAEGISSPRLGRSSSVGMGSGDSTTCGRGQPWHHVPRALHTNGQRITTRIPSWLHLTALGQHLHTHLLLLFWCRMHEI